MTAIVITLENSNWLPVAYEIKSSSLADTGFPFQNPVIFPESCSTCPLFTPSRDYLSSLASLTKPTFLLEGSMRWTSNHHCLYHCHHLSSLFFFSFKCMIVYYYTCKWVFRMQSYLFEGKWLLAFPPLVWFVFLIWMIQLPPLGSSAQSPLMWPVYCHTHRPTGQVGEMGTSVRHHLGPWAMPPLFSDILCYKSQPHSDNAFFFGGRGEDVNKSNTTLI